MLRLRRDENGDGDCESWRRVLGFGSFFFSKKEKHSELVSEAIPQHFFFLFFNCLFFSLLFVSASGTVVEMMAVISWLRGANCFNRL